MQRTQWTDRKFDLDLPEGWLPDVLERLRGTPVRLADLIQSLSDMQTSFKQNGKWSNKQPRGKADEVLVNISHELHEQTLTDLVKIGEISG